jgi:branched-chain amino acid aminotransferase
MSELLGKAFIGNGEVLDAAEFSRFHELTATHPSVYEVIRVEEGIPLFFEDYMQRLRNSFALLKRDMPLPEEEVALIVGNLIRVNGHVSGPVKLVFGAGDLHFFMAFLMRAHLPGPEEYTTGVKTVFMRETRANPNIKMWNIGLRDRSVKLLEKSEAYEAILVNPLGQVTEASRSNVFFIRGGDVYTTADEMILPGITRKKVLEVCRLHGIPVHFTTVIADEVDQFDSCFLTGTARKIVPVRLLEDFVFGVDNPVMKAISDHFESFVRQYIRQHA